MKTIMMLIEGSMMILLLVLIYAIFEIPDQRISYALTLILFGLAIVGYGQSRLRKRYHDKHVVRWYD